MSNKLNIHDKEANLLKIVELFLFLDASFPEDKKAPLENALMAFAEEQDLTLARLSDDEAQRLVNILQQADQLDLADPAPLNALLNGWKKGLRDNVICGKGVEAYVNQISGMAHELIRTGSIPAHFYGTDIDYQDCLKGMDNIENVKYYPGVGLQDAEIAPENPLAAPVKISGKDLIKNRLSAAIGDLAGMNEGQAIIPVCWGDNAHWRLVIANIKNNQLTHVELWDSLGPNPAVPNTPEFLNLQAAIDEIQIEKKSQKILVDFNPVGIQKTGYTCIDHCIQKTMIEFGYDCDVTKAKDEKALRLAVAKRIARAHKNELGEAVANQLHYEGDVISRVKVEKRVERPAAKTASITKEEQAFFDMITNTDINKGYQVEFDEEIAKNLNEMFKRDKTTDNTTLFENAKRKAIREGMQKGVGFFAEKRRSTEEKAKPEMTSNTDTIKPKSN